MAMFHAMISAPMPLPPSLMGVMQHNAFVYRKCSSSLLVRVWVYLVGNGATAADVLDTVTARVLRHACQLVLMEWWMNRCQKAESYLALDDIALLEDLNDDILLLGAAELGLKSALGGSVEGALVAVAVSVNVSYAILQVLDAPKCWPTRPMAGECETYLWVTKTLKLSTTWARGMLLSFFQSWTAWPLSAKTMKSSLSPLKWTLIWVAFPRMLMCVGGVVGWCVVVVVLRVSS